MTLLQDGKVLLASANYSWGLGPYLGLCEDGEKVVSWATTLDILGNLLEAACADTSYGVCLEVPLSLPRPCSYFLLLIQCSYSNIESYVPTNNVKLTLSKNEID
ncbi:UNVERIFIED_CONTAM: hypothetical protein Slati_1291900 [Sesamum latifolium]|uniref:Uncharacterized protein n=1 Tax=Sesamum latifolium TaxID=2727402 RepID=A0AAW2XH66_9LAMI